MGRSARLDRKQLPSAAIAALPATDAGRVLPDTVYLLIHPETFPSNDWGAVLPDQVSEDEVEPAFFRRFDPLYGHAITQRALACARRIVVFDELVFDEFQAAAADVGVGDLTVGLSGVGWECEAVNPDAIAAGMRRLFAGYQGQVLVGGYSRDDCVKRAVQALRKLGIVTHIHDEGTLPLSRAALVYYQNARAAAPTTSAERVL